MNMPGLGWHRRRLPTWWWLRNDMRVTPLLRVFWHALLEID
jgi:hypothetical protein